MVKRCYNKVSSKKHPHHLDYDTSVAEVNHDFLVKSAMAEADQVSPSQVISSYPKQFRMG